MADQEPETEKPIASWRERAAHAGAIVAKPWRRYRAAAFQGYLIVAIAIFAIMAVLARTLAYFVFDIAITQEIQEINVIGFEGVMRFLSWLGFAPQVDIMTGLVILFLYVTGLKWESITTLFGVVGVSLLGLSIKLLVDRPRPSPDLINVISQLGDYSFPSGHVLYYTTFFGFLLFLSYALIKPTWARWLLVALFGSMIALIGPSRIYLGQHWASDVLAAYLLGSVWLALTVRIYRWGKPRYFTDQPIAPEDKAARRMESSR